MRIRFGPSLTFLGGHATPLRVNVFGAVGNQSVLGPMREDLTLQCLKQKLGPWEQQHEGNMVNSMEAALGNSKTCSSFHFPTNSLGAFEHTQILQNIHNSFQLQIYDPFCHFLL